MIRVVVHAESDADERVVIAGCGPVGMIAALLLARWDVRTVLLEAKTSHTGVGSKAICFQRDVLDILDRVGCARQAVAEGVTWWHGLTFYRGHELFETTFPESGRSAFPPFINLSQSSLERHLWDRVVDTDLIDVRFGHRVVGLEHDHGGVAVDVETADDRQRIPGAYLVGCDGAGSAVRKLLELPFEGHSFDEQFLIADIRADLPFPIERRFYFDPPWNPGRQVLVHPQPHSLWRIDWQVPADFDLDHARASGELDARIAMIAGDAPYEIDWVSVYRFHQRIVPSYRVGRVLLAGDAAHLMSPFGARGLNSGAQDAENAAWKLAFALHRWAGHDLLASYDIERRAAGLENLRVTDETMRFLVPQTEQEWQWRRELLHRAVDDPEARAAVDSGKLAEPYWYMDSPLTTLEGDIDDFPSAVPGDRPIVAGVLCPDGPCRVDGRPEVTRLRQLFAEGMVVLTHTADDRAVRAAASRLAAPTSVHRLADIAIDGDQHPAAVLEAPAGSATIVRPDGHIAARIDASDTGAVHRALRRACGHRPTDA